MPIANMCSLFIVPSSYSPNQPPTRTDRPITLSFHSVPRPQESRPGTLAEKDAEIKKREKASYLLWASAFLTVQWHGKAIRAPEVIESQGHWQLKHVSALYLESTQSMVPVISPVLSLGPVSVLGTQEDEMSQKLVSKNSPSSERTTVDRPVYIVQWEAGAQRRHLNQGGGIREVFLEEATSELRLKSDSLCYLGDPAKSMPEPHMTSVAMSSGRPFLSSPALADLLSWTPSVLCWKKEIYT